MINQEMTRRLNRQLTDEYYSFWLYLAMSGWAAEKNLDGMAHWLRIQASEETKHGDRIFDYLVQREAEIRPGNLPAPSSGWESPVALFEMALEQEQKITAQINSLVDFAIEQRDHATEIFLQWFVAEQVEEEAQTLSVLQRFQAVGGSPTGIFCLDSLLGERKMSEK